MEPNLFWIAPVFALILFGLSFRRFKRPPPAEEGPPDLTSVAARLVQQLRVPGDVEIDERELFQALEALDPDLLQPLTQVPGNSALAAAEAFFHRRLGQLQGLISKPSPETAQAARHLAIFSFLQNSATAEAAYAAAQKLDPEHPAIATQIGALALRRGDPDSAQRAYESALVLAQAADDRLSSAVAQGNLGVIEQARGNLPAAEALHRSALAENQALRREGGIAVQCSCLGILFDLNGDHDRARRFRREAVSVSDHAAHESEVLELFELLARNSEANNDLEAADAYLQRALAVQEALNQMTAVAEQHEKLGALAERRSEPELARQHWTQALEVYEVQGDRGSAQRVKDVLEANPPPH